MGFVDKVGEKVSSEIIEPCGEGLKKHPRHVHWGFQTLGDIGLSISGALTQNWGRAATGILGTVRDVSFFPLRKYMAGHADTICSVVALGTNIPQLMRAATGPETAAVALVMTGWSLKAAPGLLDGLASDSVHRFIRKPMQSLKEAFSASSAMLFGTIPSMIFSARGVMQLTDGLTRHDRSAQLAGLCFIFGGVASYFAGRKHLQPALAENVSAPGPI